MPINLPDLGALLASTGGPAALGDELGASTLPLALFPVRLETRFFTGAGGGTELRVRIYPDKVHIDSHDPALTADELTWGRRYWTLQWQAEDDSARRDAWRMLANRFGPERAAWIARALTPSNLADRPAGTPQFPDLGAPVTTTRTPLVRLLPARWVATAYSGGAAVAVATGKDITSDLAIGPDLSDATAPSVIDDEMPALDEGMRWMVDFDRAEQVGMALRIALPSPTVDVLLVTGMRDGDASRELAAQLDAHHYSDGLAFLPVGTPTNNTAGGRSGYRQPDPQQDQSYADEWLAQPGPGSAADAATKAFGVAAFGSIAGSTDSEPATAGAMLTALWPVTWGYYLAQMIGFDGALTVAARDWVRSHALEYLRPGGPVPVLRCGRQPYGILPVTSLDGLTPQAADPTAAPMLGLRRLLVTLRDNFWRPASFSVPRVGMTDNPSADLVDLLQVGATSSSYVARGVMGQHFLQHLWAFLGLDLDFDGYWAKLVQLATEPTDLIGLGFAPAIAHAAYEDSTSPLLAPLVGDPEYIGELLSANVDDVFPAPTTARPLLHVLLRHALLRQYAEAAARLLDSPTSPFAELVRDAELVDLVPNQPATPTWSSLRSQPTPGGGTVADQLAANPGPEVSELRTALHLLAAADVPTLERHLAATLDVTSHRLDAWVTSLASRRLAELRAQRPTGIATGGYGWVENLRAAAALPSAPATEDEPAPLLTNPNDPGFIHAPSLNQASVAALLRNAHLAHGAQEDSPYAIQLSSARVRLARQLFDGVRQGQPLTALLGYVFERGLHDAGLDEFIDDFRALAPLPGAEQTRLVVDGLVLSGRWQADPTGLLGATSVGSLPESDSRRAAVGRVLDSLAVAVDSAADMITAESAFQMVRGNFARAAGSLDAIASGQAMPPDIGFVRTPRTGVGLTHRLLMVFPGTADAPPVTDGWAPASPRSSADPVVAAWAARLLGSANGISARVDEIGSDGGITATHAVALTALNLTPIDLIWATGGATGAPPELVSRILDAALAADNGPSPTANLRVELGDLAGIVELAACAERLLAGARPADGADLQSPRDDPVRGLDLDEFEQRVEAVEQALVAARAALTAAIGGAGVRAAMLQVAAFGVSGAVPAPGVPLDVQAQALLPELARRLAPVAPAAPSADEARRDQLLDRLRAVFGPGFLALPRFAAANAEDLSASLSDAANLYGDDPLAAYTWVDRMARVRPALGRIGRALSEAEVLGSSERLDLSIAQIPHVPGQRWIGLDLLDDGAPPTDGCISLILQGSLPDLSQPLCGMLVDEVTEVLPSRTETTGIAFQYDPPDAAAPQAILLAVPPVVGEPWRVGSLNRVLLETLDLVRIRGVDPAALGDIAHYLPTTYLAFNAGGDAVSTDLYPSTR